MSERGSFVTSFIYCTGCHAALHKALEFTDLCMKMHGGQFAPGILAGFIRGSRAGEEFDLMEAEIARARVCHPARVAVHCDNGRSAIFSLSPGKEPMVVLNEEAPSYA